MVSYKNKNIQSTLKKIAFQQNFNIVNNIIFQTLKDIYTVWAKCILIMQYVEKIFYEALVILKIQKQTKEHIDRYREINKRIKIIIMDCTSCDILGVGITICINLHNLKQVLMDILIESIFRCLK